MIWRFGIEWYGMEIRHDVSRREDCMKNFCEYIREHAMKVINLKKKKMIPLTNEQHASYEKAKICKKKGSNNIAKEISVVFHNRSNYNYCFIIKELAKEFEREFNCLEKN